MRQRIRSMHAVASALVLSAGVALCFTACSGSNEASVPHTGRGIFVASCQTCHGRHGEGFVGPSLIDVAAHYPDVADQIALVTRGVGQMPGWGGRLTAKQIATVVDYTRVAFTTAPSTSTTTTPIVGPTLEPTH